MDTMKVGDLDIHLEGNLVYVKAAMKELMKADKLVDLKDYQSAEKLA